MAPESFCLVNVYCMDELAKGREGGQKDQICQICRYQARNNSKGGSQEGGKAQKLLLTPQTRRLRSPCTIKQPLGACLYTSEQARWPCNEMRPVLTLLCRVPPNAHR